MEVKKYIQENEQRFLEELFSLIRIPSISAQSSHKDDIWACAERWRELLIEAGVDLDHENIYGNSARKLILESEDKEFIKLLEQTKN